MNGRKADRLEKAAAAVRERVPGAKVRTVVGNVATTAGCKAVTDAIADLDILVNMAGGTDRVVPFLELTDEDWQYQWDFNVMSGVRLTRHYVPLLLKKDFGRIIFMTSEAGLATNITPSKIMDYCVVKAGVIRLSRCVSEIFAHTNVTVNCVAPGPTLSEWVERTHKASGIASFQEFERGFFEGQRANLPPRQVRRGPTTWRT